MYRAVTSSGHAFQRVLLQNLIFYSTLRLLEDVLTSQPHRTINNSVVWASPRSFATTKGMQFVSIPLGTKMFQFPRFTPYNLCIQLQVLWVYHSGFPHSDISGSKVACHLAEAFRRLLRPSSSIYAKASTICSFVVSTHRSLMLTAHRYTTQVSMLISYFLYFLFSLLYVHTERTLCVITPFLIDVLDRVVNERASRF